MCSRVTEWWWCDRLGHRQLISGGMTDSQATNWWWYDRWVYRQLIGGVMTGQFTGNRLVVVIDGVTGN